MDFSLQQCELFGGQEQDSLSGKTSLESSVTTKDEALLLWLERWQGYTLTYRKVDGETPVFSSGQTPLSSGQFWMRNSSEFRSGAVASSLSEILETGPVDRRYFLSPKACKGILRRESGQVAPTIPARSLGGGGLGSDFDCDGGAISVGWGGNNTSGPIEVATACNAHGGSGRMDFESETLVTAPITGRPYADRGAEEYGLIVGALTQGAHPGGYNGQDAYSGHLVTHSLSADGFDASEDGTGRGTPLVPCCITGDKTHTLDSFSSGRATEDSTGRGCPIVAFDCKASGRNGFGIGEQSPTLRSMGHKDTHQNAGGQVAVLSRMAVRRLTPRECERLQGVPDGFTLVSRNGKPMADGPRYKMLGNGFAVPVVRWIGERLAKAVK